MVRPDGPHSRTTTRPVPPESPAVSMEGGLLPRNRRLARMAGLTSMVAVAAPARARPSPSNPLPSAVDTGLRSGHRTRPAGGAPRSAYGGVARLTNLATLYVVALDEAGVDPSCSSMSRTGGRGRSRPWSPSWPRVSAKKEREQP